MKFSKTFLKNVERFKKQQARFKKIESAYNTYSTKYYAKSKRQNLLSNQNEILNVDPYSLSPKELNKRLTENASIIRQLGFNSKMSGDTAEASVLVELNNEAYDVTNWAESEQAGMFEYDLLEYQQEIFGQMLFDNLKNLRLTNYQLKQVLSRSILPDYILEEIESQLKDYWSKLRK